MAHDVRDFRVAVKCALLRKGWDYKALAAEVEKRTGLFCDSSYVSHILAGRRKPDRIITAIREILEV